MSAKKRTSTRLRTATRERMEHTGEKYTAALAAIRGAIDLGFPEGIGTLVRQEWVSSDDSGQVSFDTSVLLTVLSGTYLGHSQDIEVHTWLDGDGITSSVVLDLGENGDYEECTVSDVFGERAPLVDAWLASAHGDGPVYVPSHAEEYVSRHFPHANRETTILATALFEHVLESEHLDTIDGRIVHLTREFAGLLDDGDEIERVSGGREVVDRLSDMTASDRNIALSPLRSMLRALDESYAEAGDDLPAEFGVLVSQIVKHDNVGLPSLVTTIRCSLDGVDQDVPWVTWDDDGLNTEGKVQGLGFGSIETELRSPDEVYPAHIVGALTEWIERSWSRRVASLPSGGIVSGSALPHHVLSPSLPTADVLSLVTREMDVPFDADAFAAAAIKSLRDGGVAIPERIQRPISLPDLDRDYEPEGVSYAKDIVLDCVDEALGGPMVEEYDRSIELADALVETLIAAGVAIPDSIVWGGALPDSFLGFDDLHIVIVGSDDADRETLTRNIAQGRINGEERVIAVGTGSADRYLPGVPTVRSVRELQDRVTNSTGSRKTTAFVFLDDLDGEDEKAVESLTRLARYRGFRIAVVTENIGKRHWLLSLATNIVTRTARDVEVPGIGDVSSIPEGYAATTTGHRIRISPRTEERLIWGFEVIDLGDGHVLVCGGTGSGKSNLVQMIARRERESGALVWSVPSEASWVDPSATTPPEWADASVTLEGVAKEVRRRYSQMESAGKSRSSEIGLPPIVAVIDGGFSLSGDELSRLAEIVRTSRGAGVRVVHAAQNVKGYGDGVILNFPNRFLMGSLARYGDEALRILSTESAMTFGSGKGMYVAQSGSEGIMTVPRYFDPNAHAGDTRPPEDFIAR